MSRILLYLTRVLVCAAAIACHATAVDAAPFQRPEVVVSAGHGGHVMQAAKSSDGRFLVTAGEKLAYVDRLIDQVFVWEATTGNRVAALPDGLPIGASAVAFSGDVLGSDSHLRPRGNLLASQVVAQLRHAAGRVILRFAPFFAGVKAVFLRVCPEHNGERRRIPDPALLKIDRLA